MAESDEIYCKNLLASIPVIKEKLGKGRPSWDEYFMGIAEMVSSRSSCLKVRAGAVITDKENQLVGTGYNGNPYQLESCYSVGACAKELRGLDYEKSLNQGYCNGAHAERNAMGYIIKTNSGNLTLYTTIFPCHECARDSLAYHVDRIVFKSLYSSSEFPQTLYMLRDAKVNVERLDLSPERFLEIAFGLSLPFQRKFDVWTPEEQKRIKEFMQKG